MKRIYFLFLLALWIGCTPGGSQGPAGHWEGNIILPGMQLVIRVDLEKKDASGWKGTIDIPAQGVRNMNLSGATVDGHAVAFGMAGVPGDPKFSGKLGGQGKEISGNFTQGGQTFPFRLERKAKSIMAAADETPSKGVPGKGVIGFWQGSLRPIPGTELRLVLEITNGPQEKLGGTLVSLDQGNARVPMTALTLETNLVNFETQSIGGLFDGDLSEDGAEIHGEWQQLGRVTPVTFFRLANAPRSVAP